MSLMSGLRERVNNVFDLFGASDSSPKRIGIYGPPNAGKSTLANRIAKDWTGETLGAESPMPHETRRAQKKQDVKIEDDAGNTVTIDIVDTPGVVTEVDYEEFVDLGMDEEDAMRRSRESTEGIAEAMHWLREDIEGVIYVIDATEDPFTQTNTMLTGIIESQDLPIVVLANKTDRDDSDVQRVKEAYPQHITIPVSAKEGDNIDEVYSAIAEHFG